MGSSFNYRFFEDWNVSGESPGLPDNPLIRVYVDPATKKLTVIDSEGNPALAGSSGAIASASASFLGTGESSSPLKLASQMFNVRDFGAKGDTVITAQGVATVVASPAGLTPTTTTLTVTGLPARMGFTQADIGKVISGTTSTGINTLQGTITAVHSATQVVIDGFCDEGISIMSWGTPDDAAFVAACAAIQAQISVDENGYGPAQSNCILYIPAGNYLSNGAVPPINLSANASGNLRAGGFSVLGEGSNRSIITLATGAPTTGLMIAGIALSIVGLGFDGLNVPTQGAVRALQISALLVQDLNVYQWNGLDTALHISGNDGAFINVQTFSNRTDGIGVQGSNLNFYNCATSNNLGAGLTFVLGASGSGASNWFGGLIDESEGQGNAGVGNVIVDDNGPVHFWGTTIFATASPGVLVIGSQVHFHGCVVTPFSGEGGISIDSGSTVFATDTLFGSINFDGQDSLFPSVNNQGIFNDLGGNQILHSTFLRGTNGAWTESGSVATVDTQGVPHGLTAANIGQTAVVSNVSVSGYNGTWPIAAVPSATSVSFTINTTGLGAATGGAFTVQTKFGGGYVGNPPVTSGTVGTFSFSLGTIGTVTFGKFTPQKDVQIKRIEVNSTASTVSSVAPTIVLSNGNISKTLTLTSGASYWDSGELTDTFFVAGIPVTVSATQGTSSGAPANLNVTLTVAYLGVT